MHSILGLVCTDCCKSFLDYLSKKVSKFYKRGCSYSLLGGRHVSWSPQRKWSQRHSPGSSKSSSNLQSLTSLPPDEAPASIVRDFGFGIDFRLLAWSPTTMKTRRRIRRTRRMNFLLRFFRTFFSAWTVSIFSFVTSILIMRAGKKRFWFLQFNGHVKIVTVDMILHPVQLVSLQTDQGGKIHEDPVDLDDLLLHPQHILVSEEGKGATTNSLSLNKIIQV